MLFSCKAKHCVILFSVISKVKGSVISFHLMFEQFDAKKPDFSNLVLDDITDLLRGLTTLLLSGSNST